MAVSGDPRFGFVSVPGEMLPKGVKVMDPCKDVGDCRGDGAWG